MDVPAERGPLRRRASAVFSALWRASPTLMLSWWVLLVLGAALPAVFAVLTGRTIGAIAGGEQEPVFGLLAATAICFLLLQVMPRISEAVSASLGHRLAGWLNRRLVSAELAPDGIVHLEDPSLTAANDFDRGGDGPPLHLAVDFMRGSLLQLLVGLASALVLAWYNWWAALLLVVAWGSTHWLLRHSAMWEERGTEDIALAQQHSSYAYELAVEPWAAKELRLFGLGEWSVDRFVRRRRVLHDAQINATRFRKLPLMIAAFVVIAANLTVFGSFGILTLSGGWSLGTLIAACQLAIGVRWVAFGGLGWALDDVAAEVTNTDRVIKGIAATTKLTVGSTIPMTSDRSIEVELRGVGFRYPLGATEIYRGLDLHVRPGESLAIVGPNGAGKTSLAKLLCRFYDPGEGVILVDGVDLKDVDIEAWRDRVTAVFQDSVNFERSLRDNVDPSGRCSDDDVLESLRAAGAESLAELTTPMSKRFENGVELSGGQWQRVALARVLCAVRAGAGLVILDEPTANLDVRAEEEIFSRLLEETAAVTTILISHRFSTVRKADRVAVLVEGRIVEIGSHDELMSLDSHYRHMFDLQASRFAETEESGEDGNLF